jgi:hypothetical protein
MIPELPFLLSVAALSLSLAGLAGLVAGLRRSDGLRPIDMFRLREIVEFAFANALVALSIVPITTIAGSVEAAVRIVAAGALVYLIAVTGILFRRLRQADIAMTTWVRIAGALDIAILVGAVAAVATGSMAAMEVLLLLFLARPMVAFLFVLASFDADLPRSSAKD